MNNYIDKYGRYHHKPCKDGESSSNNGWIYTAYANDLGLDINIRELRKCFHSCLQVENDVLFINRSPAKQLPPMSRDEILGLANLGLIRSMYMRNWNFSPKPIPTFNPIKLIKQLWQLRPTYEPTFNYENQLEYKLVWKHRNYFWENNLDQLYRFAFSVPLTDRYYIVKHTNIDTSIPLLYWAIAKIDSWFGKDSGIRYLKYGKSKEAMLKEFPEDHPFKKA